MEYGRSWSDPTMSQPNLHEAWRGLPKYKLHAEYTNGNFDVWARYTRGGEYREKMDWWPAWYPKQGDGYQQLAMVTKYTQELSDDLDIDYSLSFDIFDYEKQVYDSLYSHREDEYQARILARWNPNDDHHLALGTEYSHEKFGLDSLRFPNEPALDWTFDIYSIPMETWKTRMYSFLAEYQWNLFEDWTIFLGGRMDDHTLAGDMYSPRATLIYTPTERDTAKLMYTRSSRTGLVADLKVTDILYGQDTKPEKIDAFELRYERQQTDHLWLAASGFYNYHDLTGYDFNVGYTTNLGNLETYGFEAEAVYGTEETKVIFSHAFTKLIDWDPEPGLSSVISSQPDHYGHDLAQWCNHITKLALHHDITEKLSGDASVRAYWGYPGFKDYARSVEGYYNDLYGVIWVPPAHSSQFRPSFFTNLGFQYDISKDLYVRLDGHDLLGFIDHDNNQRLFGYYMEGDTRSTTPSVSLSVSYKF
ncbi:MAG: hypothetical protein KJ645_08470, partial [Planctomycetes bacterium]|nr:hypothetical protein [Planctomycetota bacterium]